MQFFPPGSNLLTALLFGRGGLVSVSGASARDHSSEGEAGGRMPGDDEGGFGG